MQIRTRQEPTTGVGPNGRRARRRKTHFPVVVHSVGSHRGTVFNISERGMFVALDESLPVDSLVEVEFRMPNGRQTLRIIGEVCWARGFSEADGAHQPGVGIEFWNLGSAGRDHLRRFVRAQEEDRFLP